LLASRSWRNVIEVREGRITHFEASSVYFAFAPTEEQQLEELLAAGEADPDLGGGGSFAECGFGRGLVLERLDPSLHDYWPLVGHSRWSEIATQLA
jgi:hypothetical protein